METSWTLRRCPILGWAFPQVTSTPEVVRLSILIKLFQINALATGGTGLRAANIENNGPNKGLGCVGTGVCDAYGDRNVAAANPDCRRSAGYSGCLAADAERARLYDVRRDLV